MRRHEIIGLLRKCAETRDLLEGRNLHAHLLRQGYEADRLVGNLLVRMYGECGSLHEACSAFVEVRSPNVFTWNTMLAAFARNGHLHEAGRLFEMIPEVDAMSCNLMLASYAQGGCLDQVETAFFRMPDELKDVVSWNTLLTAYAQAGHLDEAKWVFENAPKNVVSWTAMLTAYTLPCTDLQNALILFQKMPERTVVSWSAMATAYAHCGHLCEAKDLFENTPQRNLVLFNSMMQAYSRALHDQGMICSHEAEELFNKMPERNATSHNIMLHVYMESGLHEQAQQLFISMPQRNVASWTSLLCSHTQDERTAALIFTRMPCRDTLSYNTMIQVYGQCGNVEAAKRAFDHIPLGDKDALSWNALAIAYARNGHMEGGKILFEKMPLHTVTVWTSTKVVLDQDNALEDIPLVTDAVWWNAMIAANARLGRFSRLMGLFRRMQLGGVRSTHVTFTTIADACADNAADEVPEISGWIELEEAINRFPPFGNALINMYSKRSRIEHATGIFESMRRKDLATWSAMVAGFAWNGLDKRSTETLQDMLLEGLNPNAITMVNIISACNHAGLLTSARSYFLLMLADLQLEPVLEHYECVADLLGRAGKLAEAEDLINSIPFQPTFAAWMSLVASCRYQGDAERGDRAAQAAAELDCTTDAPYLARMQMPV